MLTKNWKGLLNQCPNTKLTNNKGVKNIISLPHDFTTNYRTNDQEAYLGSPDKNQSKSS